MSRVLQITEFFGLPIYIDLSWIIIVLLISWTLAVGWFPYTNPELSTFVHWLLALTSALLMFASLLAHEIAHSLVARKMGIPIKGITLFIFGGVAQLEKEPQDPKVEFLMAIAGPLTSIVLGLIFLSCALLLQNIPELSALDSILTYLMVINFIVAIFNLIPGFPLDGGRILRSIIWHYTKSLRRATAYASSAGKFFAYLLIFYGVVNFFLGAFIGGLWAILIGFFLREAAASSYQQIITKSTLRGISIRDIMTPNVIAIPATSSITEAIEEYFLKYHHMTFPVIQYDRIVGLVSLQDIKKIDKDKWSHENISELMTPISEKYVLHPEEQAVEALTHMVRDDLPALPIVEDNQLLGVISQRDILKVLKIKMDLEG
ncbi:MAG: site-2 protease family protein [bacterium]